MANGGFLTGGYYTAYPGQPTTGIPRYENQWGLVTGNLQYLGQSRQYPITDDPQDDTDHSHVQYSWLFFTDQPTLGALKIVGGRQLFFENNAYREDFVWGNRAPFEQEVYVSRAYSNNIHGWTDAHIMLSVVEASNPLPGFQIVGIKQLTRDEESNFPYVVINEWGNTTAQEQFIGIGEAWSEPYSWGFSQLSLFLTPA